MKIRSWIRKHFSAAHSVRRSHRRGSFFPTSTTEALEDRLLLTFNIVFDYTYDSTGFFGPQERRDVLEQVASVYESRITDDLAAIVPGGGPNTWSARFNDPSTGSQVILSNITIPADTIIVYVGARNLTGTPIPAAVGGYGAATATGTTQFVQNVLTRGETGVNTTNTSDTDFSLWGGTMTFNSNFSWNFNLNPPSSGQNDLYSVALHEMGHILGAGTSESFFNLINGSNQFIGSQTSAAYGGPVPIQVVNGQPAGHFEANVQGVLPGTATVQEVLFDPSLTVGSRKLLTNIDWAAIDDLGWDVTAVAGPVDYGDAPDGSTGTGPGNYRTRSLDNGPRHQIVPGLKIGASVDGDDGSLQNSTASADDAAGTDDEDFTGSDSLTVIEGVAPSISINVTNTTGSSATLYGWIDFNGDGVFSSGTESANVVVPTGANDGTVTINFPVPAIDTAGATFARFRLSSDAAAASSTGPASNGEVEDHIVTILSQLTAYDSLPLFTWSSTPGAVRYELEVNNATTGQNQVILQSNLTETSFRPHAGLLPGTYNWRYRPHNGTTFLPWSPFVQYRVFAKTGTPFITDPVAGSVDSLPTIAWSPMVGATRYELWVNETNQDRVIYQSNLPTTSFTAQHGLAAGNYTAWVRAYSGSNVIGIWSPAFTFSLTESASSVLTDPVAASVNTVPTFAWLPTSSPGYTLRVHNLSTGISNVVVQQNLSGTSFTLKNGLPPGSYSATIESVGTVVSAARTFEIQSVNGQAEFTTPVGDSNNPLPVFGWTAVNGATRYELWVDDVSGGVSRIIHSSSIFDTAYAVEKPLKPGTYRAWVRAWGNAGAIGSWSGSLDYRVTEASAVPNIWSPNGTSDNGAPRFVWSNVLGAHHYRVVFGYGPTGGSGSLPLTQDNVRGNSLLLDTAFAPGDYQVTVTALNSSGALMGSAVRRFVVASTNGPLRAYSPAGNEENSRPTFTWSTVASATRYVLWVNDVTRSINAHILKNNLTSPVFTPDQTLAAGNYRFWTRAYNGSNPVSNWSAGVNFSITESAAPPKITAPLNNTISSVPTITWNHVAGAATYEVEIHDQQIGSVPRIAVQNIVDTSFRPAEALPPALYAVRLRSVNSSGAPSAWGDTFEMTIESSASAVVSSPLAGSTNAAANVLLAWSSVTTATRYELWVNNLTTGTLQVIYETTLTTNSYTPPVALPTGNYRLWVRGIAADNTPSAWSSGVDFAVAAADRRAEGSHLELDIRPALNVARLAILTRSPEPTTSAEVVHDAGTSAKSSDNAECPADEEHLETAILDRVYETPEFRYDVL